MNKKSTRIPTYINDEKRLFQITEFIVNGKKKVVRVPLQAYQTISYPKPQS